MADIKYVMVKTAQTFSYEGKIHNPGDEPFKMDERDFKGLTDPAKPEGERIKLTLHSAAAAHDKADDGK